LAFQSSEAIHLISAGKWCPLDSMVHRPLPCSKTVFYQILSFCLSEFHQHQHKSRPHTHYEAQVDSTLMVMQLLYLEVSIYVMGTVLYSTWRLFIQC
jgi:hypothetical protein